MLPRFFTFVCACALISCDLPTDPAAAREHLDGSRSIRFTIPVPEMQVSLREQMTRPDFGLGDMLDTATFMLRMPEVTARLHLDQRVPAFVTHGAAPSFSITTEENVAGLEAAATSEVLRDVQWSDVQLTANIDNQSGAMLALDSIIICSGNARVALPAAALAAGQRHSVESPASELANVLLRRAASGHQPRVSVRVVGKLSGSTGARGEHVAISLVLTAPMHFRLPPAGLNVERRTHMIVDSVAAGATRALKAGTVELHIANNSQLASQVTMVLAASPLDTAGFDPLKAVEAVRLAPVELAARAVTNHIIAIPVDQLSQFRSGRVSVALLVRLSTGDAAVALQRADAVTVGAVLRLEIMPGLGDEK
jgi:hypothetical protein